MRECSRSWRNLKTMLSLNGFAYFLTVVCLNVVELEGCSPWNPCDFQAPCVNGGTCHRNETTCFFYCECSPGYTGVQCETEVEDETGTAERGNFTGCEVDKCLASSPCSNGGTCLWNLTSCKASCQCATGYTGEACDHNDPVDPVNPVNKSCGNNPCSLSNPCINGGSCILNLDCEFHCDCPSNHTGELCETFLEPPTNGPKGSTATSLSPPTLRPYEERTCGGGFTCLYGTCGQRDGKNTCICDKGHTGDFCELPCPLDCGENGICDRLNIYSPVYCNCLHTHTGDFCEEEIKWGTATKASDEWKYWVIGSFVFLVVLLGSLLLLGYVLVRRRNIIAMQVLYYFQPYEDEDGKLFDAFVSYKSSPEDEVFVYHTLFPKLEKEMGFKLCLHQRDFMVGETIANNIIWAIENSRRSILILSPSYMESDFTRFEYQVAHDEMLKQKHKVIPLLLVDISHQKHLMDRTLASILKSITYIEWPGESKEETLEKFWKRLELSLPKKKPGSESGTPGADPVTSFDNSAFTENPVDLEMISMEDGKAEKNGQKMPDIENVEKDISEMGLGEKQLNKKELKSFFDEPVNDEVFNAMREKALEYEQCLDV